MRRQQSSVVHPTAKQQLPTSAVGPTTRTAVLHPNTHNTKLLSSTHAPQSKFSSSNDGCSIAVTSAVIMSLAQELAQVAWNREFGKKNPFAEDTFWMTMICAIPDGPKCSLESDRSRGISKWIEQLRLRLRKEACAQIRVRPSSSYNELCFAWARAMAYFFQHAKPLPELERGLFFMEAVGNCYLLDREVDRMLDAFHTYMEDGRILCEQGQKFPVSLHPLEYESSSSTAAAAASSVVSNRGAAPGQTLEATMRVGPVEEDEEEDEEDDEEDDEEESSEETGDDDDETTHGEGASSGSVPVVIETVG